MLRDAAFQELDVVVMPTMKMHPPKLTASLDSENGPGPNNQGLISIWNTFPFNTLGLPAIGVMIRGPRFSEGGLLALAAAYERTTQWHSREQA